MSMRRPLFPETFLRRLFDIAIFIKGFDGFFEFIGGLLFLFVSHQTLNNVVAFLTQHELDQDPDDTIANAIVQYVVQLPDGTKIFGALYLLLHGFVKIFLVVGLWKDKLWAYPISIGFITLFLMYQSYRLIFLHFSWPLLVFTCLDAIFVLLIVHEWNIHHGRLQLQKEEVAASERGE